MLRLRTIALILSPIFSLALSSLAVAQQSSLKLSSLFQNNMVIQRETDAAIWGSAKANATVSIKPSWASAATSTTADALGVWKTTIKTPKAGGPHTIVVISGNDKKTLKNVLSGEVWVCSGQSNMQWKMVGSGKDLYAKEIKAANYPNIRYCAIALRRHTEEQSQVPANWKVCSPRTVSQFSSVAFFFAEKVYQETQIPIGLISCNWGGSTAEAWISESLLHEQFPEFSATLNAYQPSDNNPVKKGKKTPKARSAQQAKQAQKISHRSPAALYNGMLKPLIPFSIRGVLWYQGEANIKRPEQYTSLFPSLIKNWRDSWNIGDFPFYYVQIAPFSYETNPGTEAARLREAQLKALSLPNTAMVVTMDIGNPTNIHPIQKKPVGERLASIALARNYGQTELMHNSPVYTSSRIEGDKFVLSFDLHGSTLATPENGQLTHFTIAGEDKKFVPAIATIKGDNIIVSSPEVSQPVAVRFGWGNADAPNLKNKEGLPASSFRTDSWPRELFETPQQPAPIPGH